MVQAAALAQPLPVVVEPGGAPPALRVAEPAPSGRLQAARPRLEIPAYQAAEALTLARELGVGHVLAQVLVRRGLGDPVQARRFLDAREAHDPSEFAGIERAMEVIRGHIAEGGRIVVHAWGPKGLGCRATATLPDRG